MDIIAELHQSREKGMDCVSSDLRTQHDELGKKIHLLNVLSLVNQIEQMQHHGFFTTLNASFISFSFILFPIKSIYATYLNNEMAKIDLDSYGQECVVHEMKKSLVPIFDKFLDVPNNMGEALAGKTDRVNFVFPLDEHLRDELLKLFLCKDLKATLEFSQLHASLADREASPTKLKI